MIQALKARIIVKPEEAPKETASGISLLGNINLEGMLRRGTIVSVGSLVEGLKAGDKVCYTDLCGQGFEFEGQRYINMNFLEVMGTYE